MVLYSALPSSMSGMNCVTDITQVNVSSWYFLPLYFQAVRGASPVRSGVLLMPIVVIQALVGVGIGGIIYRFNCIRLIIWTGMLMTTVGFSLFITMRTTTSLASLIAIEVVAAIGIGAVFQAPLVAYQAAVDAADMAIATALFGFVRSLSTSISVVVGGVVFQNTIGEFGNCMRDVLGNASLAQDFSAANASSSVLVVQTLSLVQQDVVKNAYMESLRAMWKMYASVGGCGFVAALLLKEHSVGVVGHEESGAGATSDDGTHGIELTQQ